MKFLLSIPLVLVLAFGAALAAAQPVDSDDPGAVPSGRPETPQAGTPPVIQTEPVNKTATGQTVAPDASATTQKPVTLDRIAFVVNEEAVTEHDVTTQIDQALAQMKAAHVTPPNQKDLEHQVIERMITSMALMQYAQSHGIQVNDSTVDRAAASIAAQNKMSLDQLRAEVEKQGYTWKSYREELKRQIAIQRLREREVDSQIVVTDPEINSYLAQLAAQTGSESEYLVSHILIEVPDQASASQIDKAEAKAKSILQRINSGEDFAKAAASSSNAPDALTGGSLGWRTLGRLPTIFANAVANMKKGDVSGIIRSPAGFHIIKLVNIRDHSAPTIVEQTHARQILVRVSETQSDEDAKAKIERAEAQLKSGTPFDQVARLLSEDMSSSKGGDLGWLSPGDTVPTFQKAMDALKPGEISPIIHTQFGYHIIQVLARRQQDVTQERKRAAARSAIEQRKSEETFANLVRQIRDSAYVDYKTADH